jgi:hypothetical protein
LLGTAPLAAEEIWGFHSLTKTKRKKRKRKKWVRAGVGRGALGRICNVFSIVFPKDNEKV